MLNNCLRFRIPLNYILFNLGKGISIFELFKNIAIPAATQFL